MPFQNWGNPSLGKARGAVPTPLPPVPAGEWSSWKRLLTPIPHRALQNRLQEQPLPFCPQSLGKEWRKHWGKAPSHCHKLDSVWLGGRDRKEQQLLLSPPRLRGKGSRETQPPATSSSQAFPQPGKGAGVCVSPLPSPPRPFREGRGTAK